MAAQQHPLCHLGDQLVQVSHEDFQVHFSNLWLVPACSMQQGRPVVRIPHRLRATLHEAPAEPPASQPSSPGPPPSRQFEIHTITANIQTIKDAPISVFNPSGLAARRQYLYTQVQQCSADIICIQEARSAAGRWKGPGLLTWRSGSSKGQYGCEVWIRSGVTSPALTLQDWRIIASSPRLLAVTCTAERFPVTVISAHAPHADRPDSEARSFWQELTATIGRVPPHRAVVVGIDANGDLHASDDFQALVGDLTSHSETTRNDELLLECCLVNGLEAPHTFPDIQKGPSWTWQHTSGRQKRIDHILFRPGPWQHRLASQALDFDIVNGARDHVAMRVRSVLTCPRPAAAPPRQRRASKDEVLDFGAEVRSSLATPLTAHLHPEGLVEALHPRYHAAVAHLPPQSAMQPKQPYLSPNTTHAFLYLRDWRAQVRTLQRGLHLILLRSVWQAWRRVDPVPHYTVYQHRLVLGAFVLQEHKLQARVHDLARRDKIRHFSRLTSGAVAEWHRTGQAVPAVAKLRWASKRAVDRRAVHAAGGYNIDAELEKQFRIQEGGLRMTPEHLQGRISAWMLQASIPCPDALPSLLELEQCCLKQKDGKAPGPDLIPNEIYRHFPTYAGRWLWRVCSYIALSGREPCQFKRALQCALYKRGPAHLPSNYRSIALLNGVAKMWHSHVRNTIGARILDRYDAFQLGGRKHIPVALCGICVFSKSAAPLLSLLIFRQHTMKPVASFCSMVILISSPQQTHACNTSPSLLLS